MDWFLYYRDHRYERVKKIGSTKLRFVLNAGKNFKKFSEICIVLLLKIAAEHLKGKILC